MENKQKLFIDFDSTLVSSIEKIVELYNTDFKYYKEYKPIHWTEINTYDFKELTLINKDIALDYFDDHRFFINLKFMDNAKEVLDKLKDKYDIIICSIGRPVNLHYKREWILNNLPYAEFIGVDLKFGNKEAVDMSGGILIDDLATNLTTSNADIKICYGDIYDWNKDWNGIRKYNWYEVYYCLIT